MQKEVLVNVEVLKLALNVLGGVWKGGFSYPPQQHISKAITALREALAAPVQPDQMQHYITPLMEQQMFDDWCPYKGNPDPRTVWAAAIDSANGLLLGASGALHRTSALAQQPAQRQKMTHQQAAQLIREMAEQPAPVQHFDHTAAANAALRDAQSRSTAIALGIVKGLNDVKLAEQPAPVQEPRFFYDEEAGELWTPEEAKDGPVGMTRLYTSPQPAQQEPVALLPKVDVCMRAEAHGIDASTPGLYGFYVDCMSSFQQPAQRTWQGLSEQEAAQCWSTSTVRTWQAIEAKLKEKNA